MQLGRGASDTLYSAVGQQQSVEHCFILMAEEVGSLEEVDATANNKENSQVKRRCFTLLPSLFRKSSRFKGNTSFTFRKHCSFEVLSDDKLLSSGAFPINDSMLAPGSPISPRVKNFNASMRNLALSRSDNPFISRQIERSNSSASDYSSSDYTTPILSVRPSRPSYFVSKKADFTSEQQLLFDLSSNDSSNLHEKLVRSPPPHFPKKLSQFVFTESYLGQIIDDK